MSQPITVEKYAVGQSVRRVEDVRLLQGLGRYSDDVRLPRQAAAAIVRSTHAHARIVRVDDAAAEAAPGVLAVWTEADLAADGLGNLPTDASRKRPGGAAAFATPRPALARGRVRHVGDPVVLVVAETREQATDAAALVRVEYEPLPAVAATADARRPGAPAVWDEAPDNIAFVWQAGTTIDLGTLPGTTFSRTASKFLRDCSSFHVVLFGESGSSRIGVPCPWHE